LVLKTPKENVMVTETPKIDFSPLLPDKRGEPDLFICDVIDAIIKDVLQHMEHPFYSLSKKPETKIHRYEHNGNWIEITPSVKGLATIYDKDILIYCISQIMSKLRDGIAIKTPHVRINCHDLLKFANRGTAGKDYAALSEAIDRLAGTRITTNIKTGDNEQYDNFGLIDAASIRRSHGLDGRLLWMEVKLSEWVFNAIRANEVLTLHPDYFRLRKPLERRVYELARKHCGQQPQWKISLENLLKKTGSQSEMKRFKQMIKGLAEHNHLPDYQVLLQDDIVIFYNRSSMGKAKHKSQLSLSLDNELMLKSDTYDKVRKVAGGYDIHMLESEWREHWRNSGKPELKSADGAFIAFCRKRAELSPIY
jgi:hypothetical protein